MIWNYLELARLQTSRHTSDTFSSALVERVILCSILRSRARAMNLKMIMKHGMLHIKNRSQLNIMLGVHNSHFAVENLLREKAKDNEFKASLSEIARALLEGDLLAATDLLEDHGIPGDPADDVHWASGPDLVAPAGGGPAEEDAEGAPRGPVAQIPHLHHLLGVLRPHLHGDGEVDLVPPGAHPSLDGEGLPDGTRCFRVLVRELGVDLAR